MHAVRAFSLPVIALSAALLNAGPSKRSIEPQPTVPYRVVKEFNVDTGSGDYIALDAINRRLYGANYKVIDLDSFKSVGYVPAHTGHSFSLATDIGRGIGRRGILFDLRTLSRIGALSVSGEYAIYDPVTHWSYLLANKTSVIDIGRGTVIDTLVFHNSEAATRVVGGVVDGQGHAYISLWYTPGASQRRSEIAVIDTRRNHISNYWTIPECSEARAVNIDNATRRLFVNCDNLIYVMSADDGHHVTSVPIGFAVDQSAFDDSLHLLISPAPNHHVAFIYPKTANTYGFYLSDSIPDVLEGLVVDPPTHRVFLLAHRGDSVGFTVLGRS